MSQRGFSHAASQILELHGIPHAKFKSFGVPEDATLRSDIRELGSSHTRFRYVFYAHSHSGVVTGSSFSESTSSRVVRDSDVTSY